MLQFTHIILAYWISITRINDYMHHPEDVIMGSIIGIACACIIMFMEGCSVKKVEKQKDNPESFEMTVKQLNKCGMYNMLNIEFQNAPRLRLTAED